MAIDTIRFFFKKLASVQHQQIYEQVLSGLIAHKSEIAITNRCSSNELGNILEYVVRDYPQLFFVAKSSTTVFNGKMKLIPDYLYSQADARYMQKQIDVKVSALLQSALHSTADIIDKERAIFAHLVQNTKYNYVAGADRDTEYSMVGPLLKGKSVCEGYSKAFKYLCDAIKLPCAVVFGSAIAPHGGDELHAWNIIRAKGVCYHVDVTWDSCLNDAPHYDYFNLSDKELECDHTWDRTLFPQCNTVFSPVHYVTGKKEFEKLVISQLTRNIKTFPVKFNKQFNDVSEILEMVRVFLSNAPYAVTGGSYQFQVRYNKHQSKAVISLS